MPNSFGTVRSAPIITAALALLVNERPLLKAIALDLGMRDPQVKQAKLGQTIMARIHSVPAVENYVKGAALGHAADTDVPLTLSDMKQVGRSFTAAELNACYAPDGETERELILEAAAPLAQSIGDFFVDGIAALWTHASFPLTGAQPPATTGGVGNRYVKAASAMDYNALVDLRTIMMQQKMPKSKRFCVLNSTAFGSLLKDPTVTARYAQQTGDTVEGTIGRIAGFENVMEHSALAAANATANLVGFSGTEDSVVFATRIPTNPAEISGVTPNSGYNYQMVVEPSTGLQVLAIEWIEELDYHLKLVWLQGWAKGNGNNGCMMTSA